MHLAVHLPLLALLGVPPVVGLPRGRRLLDRLDARVALAALAGTALLLATSALTSLGLLVAAAAAVAAVPDPVARPVGGLALLLLVAAGAGGGREAHAIARRYAAVRAVPAGRVVDGVVPVADDRPWAFARPRRHGRGEVVVSTGLLAGATPARRRALVAHERAHLDQRHHVLLAGAALTRAALPPLAPLRREIAVAVERCADESAARRVGDRRAVARAVGWVALAAAATGPAPSLGATSGPVPRRVAALLDDRAGTFARPGPAELAGAFVLAAAALAVGAALHAGLDLHALLEHAATRRG